MKLASMERKEWLTGAFSLLLAHRSSKHGGRDNARNLIGFIVDKRRERVF